ncbi:MAG: transglycosylase SLT domain-containing protein [Betaproteobacteria bacterium]
MMKLRAALIRPRERCAALLMMTAASLAAAAAPDVASLELAAFQRDPVAQTELATRYEHAEGVPRDLEKANSLYCMAARQGHSEAQFRLGWLYANGRGVVRDDGIAAALFEMAAEQGHGQAGKLLGFVRPQPDTRLPSCLLPDPPPSLAAEDLAGDADLAIAAQVPEQPAIEPAEQTEIEKLVFRLAPSYSIDPQLALAVIAVESAFDAGAVSPKNAQGLMQLIPETAERFGVKRAFNPAENIKGGLAYLRWLLAFFQGDVALVAAAYNAGERAVEKYRGIPPYAETRRYVRKITGIYTKASHPYKSDIVAPSPIMARVTRPRS